MGVHVHMSAVSAGCALGWAVLFCCEIQYGASDQVRSDYSIVSRDFRFFFLGQNTLSGPQMNRQKQFREIFCVRRVSVYCTVVVD